MQKIPVFLPLPTTLSESAWQASIKGSLSISFRDLCALAGIRIGVSGPMAHRMIHFSGQDGINARRVSDPYTVAIAETKPTTRQAALKILGLLAYGFNDYGARETVCGKGLFSPTVGRGRHYTGQALSPAERTRRSRCRRLPEAPADTS